MADVTITGLPNATVPLSGTERVPMDQGGTTVDASTQAIADLCGGSITAAVNAHVAAADPHGQYALESTLATVATTGAYGDLSNRPTLGSAAAQNVGTAAGNVVQLDNAGRLPAVDASQLTGLPSGGVSSVSGTAPIVSSGGNTPAISITAATTSAAGSMSGADKTKLDGIQAGAEVNVNADWNASSGDAQILNKPTLGTAAAAATTDFAPAAQGVTKGNSHDHNGGDGAQIAYGSLSGLPSIPGPTDLSYTASSRLLGSSTGADVTLPEASTTLAGLMSGADKTKLDGVASGAQVNVATNLTYDAASREVRSSTGDDAVLPLVNSTTAGLASATDKQKIDIAVVSDVTGITGADAVTNIVSLTQAEYDAIASPSASTLYVITS